MAYLMHIAFDNGGRLERRSYVFEYAGVQFKLVQENPRKHADHLLTILESYSEPERQRAYTGASDFAAALAWENRVATAVHENGGRGWPASWKLRKAHPSILTFPTIPFRGHLVGCALNALPTIESDQQRLALTLFREARASNNEYLSLLFYWHVLDIAKPNHPEFVADRIFRRIGGRSLHFGQSDLAALPLKGRSLGAYLRDDCRNAVAHFIRKPGKQRLEFADLGDRGRVIHSARVVAGLARECIVSELGLRKQSFLVRVRGSTIPRFVDEADLHRIPHAPAYPRLYPALVFPSPRGGRGRGRGK